MQAEKIKTQSPHLAQHGEMIRFPSGSVFHHFAAAAAADTGSLNSENQH